MSLHSFFHSLIPSKIFACTNVKLWDRKLGQEEEKKELQNVVRSSKVAAAARFIFDPEGSRIFTKLQGQDPRERTSSRGRRRKVLTLSKCDSTTIIVGTGKKREGRVMGIEREKERMTKVVLEVTSARWSGIRSAVI